MKQATLAVIAGACTTAAVAMLLATHIVHGQNATVSVYNPYPTGILPANLATEIQRVRLEENGIEAEALKEWKALVPPHPDR